ncbi:MAG: class I SAM-dependent methyltransferase [Haloarculaceae archaeon]
MSDRDLRARIADQFSGRGDRADVWRGFELFLPTESYLNLGYSPWYLPHVLGSPQRRLATVIGRDLADRLPATAGAPLLDVGCGRGGPAVHLADRFGFDVTGVDLVPYNVATARANANVNANRSASFVVGDATRLPVATDAVAAATAIDALVYVPDREAAVSELARVVRPGGYVSISDLVVADGLDDAAREVVAVFADAWDMSPPATVGAHREAMGRAGLSVETVVDGSAHSVARFPKWARLYLGLADRVPGITASVLQRWGLDADRVTEQVRAALAALPNLRHVRLVARG